MIDGCDDRASVWSESARKARKEHRCIECGRAIRVGEVYTYLWALNADGPFTGKWCAHCDVAQKWLWLNCDGSIVSAVAEDISEHARDYRRGDLARMAVGMRRGWKRFKTGELMPVMAEPRPIRLGDAA